jgi:light-regulated signal transduction histidine kinase (bacteriophytochrome)
VADDFSLLRLLTDQAALTLDYDQLIRQLRDSAAALETSNRELEAFSYSVSHDLRAPLRAIDGFSQALIEDLGPTLAPDSRGDLDRIRGAAQRMAELIDDLLNLARVARAEMEVAAVDLSALARTITADLARMDPNRAASFIIAPGLSAMGDPRLLRLVLDNLLGNAWKFSAHQPEARISFGLAPRDAAGPAVYVVRDNGAGFDMAYSEKLFGAFQRLHTVTEFEGTGIGLATVHRIVMRHGGRIWAESAPGCGAAFYFTLGSPPAQDLT